MANWFCFVVFTLIKSKKKYFYFDPVLVFVFSINFIDKTFHNNSIKFVSFSFSFRTRTHNTGFLNALSIQRMVFKTSKHGGIPYIYVCICVKMMTWHPQNKVHTKVLYWNFVRKREKDKWTMKSIVECQNESQLMLHLVLYARPYSYYLTAQPS